MDIPILAEAVEPANSFASTQGDNDSVISMGGIEVDTASRGAAASQAPDAQPWMDGEVKTPPIDNTSSTVIDHASSQPLQPSSTQQPASKPHPTVADVRPPTLLATPMPEAALQPAVPLVSDSSNGVPSDELCTQMEQELQQNIQAAMTHVQNQVDRERRLGSALGTMTPEQAQLQAKITKYTQAIIEGVKARLYPQRVRAYIL